MSIAPQISMACFSRINRAIEAPIGPTPYWMARILFFTKVSVVARPCSHTQRILAASESLTIKEFRKSGNAKCVTNIDAGLKPGAAGAIPNHRPTQDILECLFHMTAPKLHPVRALIFDLDGTLIDSKRDLIHSVNAMLAEMGRARLDEETISGYIGHGAPLLVSRALGSAAKEEELRR